MIVESPKGPKGSVVSSTASNFVTCALTFRFVLGPRRAGDCGAAEDSCVGALVDGLAVFELSVAQFVSDSHSKLSWSPSTYHLVQGPWSARAHLGRHGISISVASK